MLRRFEAVLAGEEAKLASAAIAPVITRLLSECRAWLEVTVDGVKEELELESESSDSSSESSAEESSSSSEEEKEEEVRRRRRSRGMFDVHWMVTT